MSFIQIFKEAASGSSSRRGSRLPSALDRLAPLDYILVEQEFDDYPFRVLYGPEVKTFRIKGSSEEGICWVLEHEVHFKFLSKVTDSHDNEILHFYRSRSCICCGLCFCKHKLKIYSPQNVLLCVVQRECTLFRAHFVVKNSIGDTILRVKDFSGCCRCDMLFRITSHDGSIYMGEITRKWSGCYTECTKIGNLLTITFPRDLDVRMKVAMMSLGVWIIGMYFN